MVYCSQTRARDSTGRIHHQTYYIVNGSLIWTLQLVHNYQHLVVFPVLIEFEQLIKLINPLKKLINLTYEFMSKATNNSELIFFG